MSNLKKVLLYCIDEFEMKWLDTGAEKEFIRVYRKNRRILKAYLQKYFGDTLEYDDMEDIISLTLTKLVHNRETIVEKFKEIKLQTWLIRVATNLGVDVIRYNERKKNMIYISKISKINYNDEYCEECDDELNLNIYYEFMNLMSDEFDIFEEPDVYTLLMKKLENEINTLPKDQGDLFRRKFIDGEKYLHIAKEEGVSENVIKSKVFMAKTKLKDRLFEDYQKLIKQGEAS